MQVPTATIDPPAVSEFNATGRSAIVLLCEHASNFIPARYRNLGLPEAALQRHIAWDIGAAVMARTAARRLDAHLILSGYSRLLIDCNRPLESPTSIPVRSEDTDIPGNIGISAQERALRDHAFFAPFRERVAQVLDRRIAAAWPTVLIGMHSFTPIFRGVARKWHAGVLYRRSTQLAQMLLAGLRADPALVVGENEPYRVTEGGDFTVPWQGEIRNLPTALFEVRQDLITHDADAERWGEMLGDVMAAVAAAVPKAD